MRNTGWRRLAINAFLVFHLLAIACWSLPSSYPLTSSVRQLVRPYFLWAGLFQSWDMFSPQPKFVNTYLEAIVLYNDGNTRIFRFPRMEQLSLTQRYSKERYRKFSETLIQDANSPLWPDVAKRIARLNNTGPAPLKMVMLVKYWSPINPRNPNPTWDEDIFYTYSVQPGDLQ